MGEIQMRQSQIFLAGEGKAWLERNQAKLPPENDPVIEAIKSAGIKPRRALEIGCANGWRLLELEKIFDCLCYGVDPSVGITKEAGDKTFLMKGTANNLIEFGDDRIDLLIYGFCLYLCDPEDHFKIAAEGDRVLADGGYLVIYDFDLDAFKYPHSRPYKHKDGVFSYKMRWENLWGLHPAYSVVSYTSIGKDDDMTAITILKKDMANAFPVEE